ncbi:High-affinity branched-chain amino acid transport ATP-binding protein LivF [Pararobbsia alpina]|uniref:High-affinity branched-chain amino acid transport ATP-binding protein LivF n=1 Tax=Pararobbsia alpina TaxID=621374 RepID=A0A6S7AZA9_9BURK|nr:High-affinity branched-chain amino acid transport ATP-binding protein LivF [Pararobbsia alpina]
MGVVQAKNGHVKWRDQVLSGLPPYGRVERGLAYVPQGRHIFPRLTVEENLLVGAASLPKRAKTIPERIYELFPVLKDTRARRGGDLSGGQQQLAIGRALMSEPQLPATSGGLCAGLSTRTA